MIQAWLISALVAAATGLGGVLWGIDIGINKQKAHDADVVAAVNAAGENAATKAASAIAQIEVVNKTIYNKATHEVRTNTVFADCVNTDSMHNLLVESLRGGKKAADKGGLSGPGRPAEQGLRVGGPEADRSGGAVLQVPGGSAGGAK